MGLAHQLGSFLSQGRLKSGAQNGISFDPLGVAAILHNPRAVSSTAKLYSQTDRDGIGIWPHTLMLGGALIPFKILANHLLPKSAGGHPAIEMFQQASSELTDIRSTFGFVKMPLDTSMPMLDDALGYQSSSASPHHDVIIYDMTNFYKKSSSVDPVVRACNVLIMLSTGGISGVGLWFSEYNGDVWGVTLFMIYTMHWLAGILVAIVRPIREQNIKIDPSSKEEFVIYERGVNGGVIVFKGPKSVLEQWARTTWQFYSQKWISKSPKEMQRDKAELKEYEDGSSTYISSLGANPVRTQTDLQILAGSIKSVNVMWGHIAHWSFVITGSLSTVGSVACMVNMNGAPQLLFLGLLLLSSLGEIAASRLARRPRAKLPCKPITHNKFRTEAFIRAALVPEPALSTVGLDWVKGLNQALLPPLEPFTRMYQVLKKLSGLNLPHDSYEIETIIQEYENAVIREAPHFTALVRRCGNEMREAMRLRLEERQNMAKSQTP